MNLIFIHSFTNYSRAFAQTVTRLTFNQGTDVNPTWDPRGENIVYVRSKVVNGQVFDAYRVLSSGQGGEQAILSGLNTDFGVAVALSWVGSSGFLAVEEAISGFEALSFNTALAPFDRVAANGADAANNLLLSVNGGGGGGILKISRDGAVALTRFSTSGSGGNVTIRTGPFSSMNGQVSSTFGEILISLNSGSDTPFLNGAALSPDGSQYILATPIGSSSSAHDLILRDTVVSASAVNLTNTAASGFYNVYPDISPDGSKIAFSRKSSANDTYDLYTINIDGTGLTQITNTPNFNEIGASWSPDGSSLAYAGMHVVGHESEFPALEAGESANYNIYMLTLPAVNIVTPKTKLIEPPLVAVESRSVTFSFTPFVKAQKTLAKVARSLTELLSVLPAKGPKIKYSFRYELVVTKDGGKKKDAITKLSKRNSITLKNVKSGTYTAKYRVEIMKKIGSETSLAGRTKFSPTTRFSVE